MSVYNNSEIVERYLKGENANNIAKSLNTYNTTIRRILLRHNVKLRNTSEANAKVPNIFRNYESSDFIQYWIGFIAADGCIGKNNNKISITLAMKDRDHLQKFCDYIKVPLKFIWHKRFNRFQPTVYFSNKEAKQTLQDIGITSNKSKTIKLNIPLTPSIVRGIIDGDGYVRRRKYLPTVEIATASKDFTLQLQDFFKKYSIKCVIRKTKGVYLVSIYKNEDILKLDELLYKDATIYLERKKIVQCPLSQKWPRCKILKFGELASRIPSQACA